RLSGSPCLTLACTTGRSPPMGSETGRSAVRDLSQIGSLNVRSRRSVPSVVSAAGGPVGVRPHRGREPLRHSRNLLVWAGDEAEVLGLGGIPVGDHHLLGVGSGTPFLLGQVHSRLAVRGDPVLHGNSDA